MQCDAAKHIIFNLSNVKIRIILVYMSLSWLLSVISDLID